MDVKAYEDDCATYADVMDRAERVREFRKTFLPKPMRVEIREIEVVKFIDLPMQEMFAKVAEAQGITTAQLSEAIRLFISNDGGKLQTELRMNDIQRSVCARANISREQLTGSCRVSDLTKPRHIAMALCKRLTTRSLPEIGRAFGGRDHTTVIHAVRKLEFLTSYVSENIHPGAKISEWSAMMFDHYDRLSTARN